MIIVLYDILEQVLLVYGHWSCLTSLIRLILEIRALSYVLVLFQCQSTFDESALELIISKKNCFYLNTWKRKTQVYICYSFVKARNLTYLFGMSIDIDLFIQHSEILISLKAHCSLTFLLSRFKVSIININLHILTSFPSTHCPILMFSK